MISNVRNLAHAIIVCLLFCVVPNYGQQESIINVQPDSLINAQQDSISPDLIYYLDLVKKAYGADQSLVNGVRYYKSFGSRRGNPYFLDDELKNASLTMYGQIYNNVHVKYDLYAHHLELEYINIYGGISKVFLVMDHIDGFSFGPNLFEKLEIEEGKPKYYQVIRTDYFTCYIFWDKSIHSGNNVISYTDAKETLYLEMDGQIKEFQGRKDFADFFSKEYKKEIKRFLRKSSFKFRNSAPDVIISGLIDICVFLDEVQES